MALALLLAGGVAQAIINGQPDTGPNAHPYVGAYMAEALEKKFKGELLPVCSGTLISARVFLTAGHCTQVEEKRICQPTSHSTQPTSRMLPRL
jgi:hypothetical protein